MNCPHCKKHIDYVVVVSECWQKGWIKDKKIYDYGSVESIEETIAFECPECGGGLDESPKKNMVKAKEII